MPSLTYAALITTGLAILASSATAQMSKTDQSLLDALMEEPAFTALIPKGHVVRTLMRQGGYISGPLVWGADPANLEVRPRGLKTERSVNCDRVRTRSYDGAVGASYRDTRIFTTTSSVAIAHEFSINYDFPVGPSAGYALTATVTSENGRGRDSSEEISFSHSYLAVVDPGHYIDAQLQVVEQIIEGQPFHVDVEITGNATITHEPAVQWLADGQLGGASRVSAGRENDSSGNPRELYVCRATHEGVKHPGKRVGRNCNISFDEEEIEVRPYELLSIPENGYRWMDRDAFEEEYSETEVANLETPAVIAGQETDDPDRRYDGQLLVCRAKHKGSWHPGKVVNNHCMFGWGGEEIEERKYKVLVQKPVRDEDKGGKTVRLSDYLPAKMLKFRIEGSFDGARAMDSRIVVLDQRPVAPEDCSAVPETPQEDAAETAPQSKLDVTRTPLAPAAIETGGVSVIAQDQGGVLAGRATNDTEAALAGPMQSRASLTDGVNRLDWNIRTLSRTRPFMRGADVLVVQRALTAAGWPVKQDGVYGGYTQRAVRLFQTASGLNADGIVGPATELRLGL